MKRLIQFSANSIRLTARSFGETMEVESGMSWAKTLCSPPIAAHRQEHAVHFPMDAKNSFRSMQESFINVSLEIDIKKVLKAIKIFFDFIPFCYIFIKPESC